MRTGTAPLGAALAAALACWAVVPARAQAPDPARAALVESLVAAPPGELDARLAAAGEALDAGLVEALLADVNAAQRADQHERALAGARAAERAAQRLGQPILRARALYLAANTHRARAEFAAARQAAEASLAAAREGGDRKREASALGLLGILARQQGQFEQAQALLEQALAIDEAESSGVNLANRLASLGMVHSQLGDYATALARFERSLDVRRQLDDEAGQGSAYNGIGHVYLDLGRLDLARQAFGRALALAEARANTSAAAANLFNLALIDLAEQQVDAGLATMSRCLEAARQAQDRENEASALDGLGVLERARGDDARALGHFEAALALSVEIGARATELDARTERSKALLALGRAQDALDEARRAAALGADLGLRDQLWPAQLALGRALEARDDLAGARSAYEQAIALVEDLRSGVLGGDEAQPDFLARRIEPYERLLDLDLRAGQPVAALGTAERARARALVDALVYGRQLGSPAMTAEERAEEQRIERRLRSLARGAADGAPDGRRAMGAEASPSTELEAARRELLEFRARLYASHPELRLARGGAPVATLADVAELLPDAGSVALVYAASEQRTVLFVLERDAQRTPPVRLTTYRLPLAGRALAERVRGLRAAIAARDLGAAGAARQLYEALVAPAAGRLRGRKRLLIVPDGPLWELPFAALEDRAGQALVERVALLLAPSLTALRELSRRPPAGAGPGRLALLAYANPASAGQEALPEAEAQAARLAALVWPARAVVRRGAEAREASFKEEAGRARLIHVASHGVLDGDSPLFSYLALAADPPGAGSGQDGRLEARELLELPLEADLVTLSACETALGRVQGGEGMVGLAWATLLAGARTLVVSQWRVEAAATARLMDAFYGRLLAPGTGPGRHDTAEALRAAMLQLRRDPRTRHPFYWAAFSALGNGSF